MTILGSIRSFPKRCPCANPKCYFRCHKDSAVWLRILRWEIILNYLDRPSISTRVFTRMHEGQSEKEMWWQRQDKGSERERKRAREKEIHWLFLIIITSSDFVKVFILQKSIKGERKPSLGEHSSLTDDWSVSRPSDPQPPPSPYCQNLMNTLCHNGF